MAIVHNPFGGTPGVVGGALAATGAAAGLAHFLWLAVALLVVGGSLIALAKLAPRIALEPVRRPTGDYRWGLTVNGRPVRRR